MTAPWHAPGCVSAPMCTCAQAEIARLTSALEAATEAHSLAVSQAMQATTRALSAEAVVESTRGLALAEAADHAWKVIANEYDPITHASHLSLARTVGKRIRALARPTPSATTTTEGPVSSTGPGSKK